MAGSGQLPRKLAVILHADVVGSTALVQHNEAVAHERIKDLFQRREAIWMVDKAAQAAGNYGAARPSPSLQSAAAAAEGDSEPDKKTKKHKFKVKPPGTKKTVKATKDGREICWNWNVGKCKDPCSQKRLHVCNAMLKGDRACMGKHKSCDCKNKKRL